MRKSRLSRHLLASALPFALALAAGGSGALADPLITRGLNSFGMQGGVDTPTAETRKFGELGAALSYSDYARRYSLFFQASPGLTMALRYSQTRGIDPDRDTLYDRSLDVQYQFLEEKGWRPAVAIGMRDFMGTGLYSGEYVVATKAVTDDIRVSAGLGWGRLGGNPRPIVSDNEGGVLNTANWFRGPAKPFGSISWQATDKLRVVAEYSNDPYELEVRNDAEAPDGHINLGLNYRFGQYYEASVYTIGKKQIGAQLSFALNARESLFPSGLEPAPAPVRPRPAPSADPEGWSGAWSTDPTAQPAIQTALSDALKDDGVNVLSMSLSTQRANVRIENTRYPQEAEAIGRTARMMSRALPPSVETLTITSTAKGVPTYSVTLNRSDLEQLENTNSTLMAERAVVSDAIREDTFATTPGIFPRFTWDLQPYLGIGAFDPDEPARYEVGASLSAKYEVLPGVIIAGQLRKRAFGNQRQSSPEGTQVDDFRDLSLAEIKEQNFGYARVRSDTRMYAGNTGIRVPYLTASWYASPRPAIFTRVTAGLLEQAYGGISTEALWWPADSRLALGAELNYVKQRDYRNQFGFREYEVATGHASAYYDFGNGLVGQIDAGRYLAGDWGATARLTREFANGWRIGAFATKTNMSSEAFGNGSFDKGFTLEIPVAWALGSPTKSSVKTELNSLARDGGQRVRVSGRLYDIVRDSHKSNLYDGWGKFWR